MKEHLEGQLWHENGFWSDHSKLVYEVIYLDNSETFVECFTAINHNIVVDRTRRIMPTSEVFAKKINKFTKLYLDYLRLAFIKTKIHTFLNHTPTSTD